MILVTLPAKCQCAEQGCDKSMVVELCLTVSGGFGFKPADPFAFEHWQVGAGTNGVFMCFCPEHKKPEQKIVQVGPAGLKINPHVVAKLGGTKH